MKKYSPTSPGRRQAEMVDTSALARKEPERSLTAGFQRSVGRNAQGRITTRHKGGGVKRLYRLVDFLYDKRDVPAVVEALEYDPNRTSFIALVRYADGERRYVLAPQGWAAGSRFLVSESAPIEVGNRLPLRAIPVGTFVFNIEFEPNKGAQLVRSAGAGAEVLAVEGGFASEASLGRHPPGVIQCLGNDRLAFQSRVGASDHRHGRPESAPGHPADGARLGHEPARSPLRRRRGAGPAGHPAAEDAVGEGYGRGQNPEAETI